MRTTQHDELLVKWGRTSCERIAHGPWDVGRGPDQMAPAPDPELVES